MEVNKEHASLDFCESGIFFTDLFQLQYTAYRPPTLFLTCYRGVSHHVRDSLFLSDPNAVDSAALHRCNFAQLSPGNLG